MIFKLSPLQNILGSIVFAGLLMVSAGAKALPFQLTIQPINVCDNLGNNCGNPAENVFLAETQKIWAQAGIDMMFLAFNQLNNTSFLTIDDDNATAAPSLADLAFGAGNQQNGDPTVINMYFLDDINPLSGGTTFGVAFVGGNGIAIADETFSFNGGLGRIDTIAHEIGHNLGLSHSDPGMTADYLMRSGGSRNVPGSIDDITPDGDGNDLLTVAQIATAQASNFVTENEEVILPEPAGIAAMLTGLLLMIGMVRFFPAAARRA